METKVSKGRANQWVELTQCAPGTPMGTLLRKFWHPVARTDAVAPGRVTGIRILGEDVTLYRGEGGEPHLVAQRCAHRGTDLRIGSVEGDGIRCFYHGWKYEGSGQCVEMPGEAKSFAKKVKIASYPVRDYAGCVFAFMGEGAAPPFPYRAELDREGVSWVIDLTWPTNWLQQVENSLDAVHINFVHRDTSFGQLLVPEIPKVEFEETEFGVVQRAIRSDHTRLSDFQFPNANHIVTTRTDADARTEVWIDLFDWKVPVDDTHTAHFTIRHTAATGDAARKIREWADQRGNWDPADHEDELFNGIMPADKTFLVSAQDYLAQVGQGRIADRSRERLGTSDAGIILLRKILRRELDAIKKGLPGKEWKTRAGLAHLPAPPGVPRAATA